MVLPSYEHIFKRKKKVKGGEEIQVYIWNVYFQLRFCEWISDHILPVMFEFIKFLRRTCGHPIMWLHIDLSSVRILVIFYKNFVINSVHSRQFHIPTKYITLLLITISSLTQSSTLVEFVFLADCRFQLITYMIEILIIILFL